MDEGRLLDLVGLLYDAATSPVSIGSLGALIANQVGSESALVFMARKPSAQLVHLVSTTRNFDPKAQADYRAYYHDRNEWFRRGVRLPPPTVLQGGDLIAYRDFDRTEFCNDWCGRVGIYHLLAATFPIRDGVIGAIGVHRDRKTPCFAGEDKRVLAAITPHLMRALQVAESLNVVSAEGALTHNILEGLGLGVALVDGERRPLLMNAVAERLVRDGRWLTMVGGRIAATHPSCAQAFARAVRAASLTSAGFGLKSGGVLPLRNRLDDGLQVLVAPFRAPSLDLGPMRPAAVVIFADPDAPAQPSAETVAAAYGLTPAEGRLVSALAAGATLVEYARHATISVNTAKAQLRRVFLKTGVSRQSALVGMILADPVLRLRGAGRTRRVAPMGP